MAEELVKMTSTANIQTCKGCSYAAICKFSEKYTLFQKHVVEFMKNTDLDPGFVKISVGCKYVDMLPNGFCAWDHVKEVRT